MLIVDSREDKLISKLSIFTDPDIQQLDIGDIHVIDDGKPVIIIERKTISDYISSINDGRNEEQMLRLENYTVDGYKPMIIYIVEGTKKFLLSKEKKALQTSILNKTVQHNCHVIYTKNVVDTAEKVIKIDTSYQEKKTKMDKNLPLYANIIKVKKNENITENVFYIKTLCCIPGIGKKTAGKIASVCPSLLSLDTEKLKGIVSDSIIAKIEKYIFYTDPGLVPMK